MAYHRDDFSQGTKNAMAYRVAFRCSNPSCGKLTIAPSPEGDMKTTSDGVAAHISAASPGGPRYEQNLSTEERQGIQNGIWLCSNCSILIDREPSIHPIEVLLSWKQIAESQTRKEFMNRAVNEIRSKALVNAELAWVTSSRWVYGASPLNEHEKVHHWLEVIWTYRLTWNYKLTILNNSNLLVKNFRLSTENKLLKIGKIPIHLTALESLGVLELDVKYETFWDGNGQDAEKKMASFIPDELKSVEVILEYEDVDQRKYAEKIPITF